MQGESMVKQDSRNVNAFGVANKNGRSINAPNRRMSILGSDGWLAEFEKKHSVVMSSKKHTKEQLEVKEFKEQLEKEAKQTYDAKCEKIKKDFE